MAAMMASLAETSMRSILKRKLAIGAVAVAAAAFAGGAYAATQQSGADSRQAFLNDVAKRLNVSPQQLKSALQGAFDDQLQAAVAAGKITRAQANELKQRAQQKGLPPLGLQKGLPPLGLQKGLPPLGLQRGVPLPGLRGFGGRKGFAIPGHPPVFGIGGRFSAAGKYLGLSELQLVRELSSGKSLAQVASARGKSVSELKAAMTAAVKARLDKAVAAKVITSAQEQKILNRLSSMLDIQINQRGLQSVHRAFVPRNGRLFPRWMGPPPAANGAPAPPPANSGPVY
jgi:hypothetical protein